jgi:hypothetical protein
VRKAQETEGVANQQGETGTLRIHQLRRARRDQHHEHGRGEDREPGIQRRVSEHVLQELLTYEHRAHERPEHDDPRARRDPEDPTSGYREVVQRIARNLTRAAGRAHHPDRMIPRQSEP